MNPYRVAVVGCAGRMGRMNLAAIQAAEGCVIAGGSDQPGSPEVGSDIGLLIDQGPPGIAGSYDPVELFARADAVFDFTTPAAIRHHDELDDQDAFTSAVGPPGLGPGEQAIL